MDAPKKRGRGRPPKNKQEDVELAMETEVAPLQVGADIKQIIRGINARNEFGADDSQPVDVINDYLRSYFAQGYKLMHVQHLRSNMSPEGNTVLSEQMLYVLYKEE